MKGDAQQGYHGRSDDLKNAPTAPEAHSLSPSSESTGEASPGTPTLRGVAESLFLIRKALEHGNVPGAREAARRLVEHLDRLPEDREEYERLCEAADRELSANPDAWDQKSAGGR